MIDRRLRAGPPTRAAASARDGPSLRREISVDPADSAFRLDPATVIELQRRAGNQALLTSSGQGAGRLAVQRKRYADERPSRLASMLLAMPLADAEQVVAVTSDPRRLQALAAALDRTIATLSTPAPADEIADRLRLISRWAGLRVVVNQRRLAVAAASKVIAIVKRKGRGLTAADVGDLTKALAGLPPDMLREVEREVLLWPSHLPATKKQQALEVVTGPLRARDLEALEAWWTGEAEQGRFDPVDGAALHDELLRVRREMSEDTSKCLRFLELATGVLVGEQDGHSAVTRYHQGIVERRAGLHSDATLSRLAAELRLQGVVGPVHTLPWKGTPEKGRHRDPTPESLLTALSSAGPGWYFFYVALFGHHTRLIAVEVTESGERRFLLLEHLVLTSGAKPAERDITGRVNQSFDDFGRPDDAARLGSRVWQVYARRPG